MLLLGGVVWGSRSGSSTTGIWQLKEEEWRRIGEFSERAYGGSAVYVGSAVYYFESVVSAIYRLDLDENEELVTVERIGSKPGTQWSFPVLFETDIHHCT